MNFSKSKYLKLWQCPKILWMDKYMPEQAVIDESVQKRFDTGNAVGETAKGLFGKYADVKALKFDGSPDFNKMIEITSDLILYGENVICEAAFSYKGLYCGVDILKKVKGGYELYEVKSSTGIKDIYLPDVAFQKYVFDKCGINVLNSYIIYLNNEYTRNGILELDKLFSIINVTDLIKKDAELIEENLMKAEKILSSDTEPDFHFCKNCTQSNDCCYIKYCTRHIPENSVFNLYRYREKFEMYEKGIISYQDLLDQKARLNDIQKRQIEYATKDLPIFADKRNIANFLKNICYPLYFLDFETMQQAIPEYDRLRPYQQIPFQYSLHYVETEGGELIHKEFLAKEGTDPRYDLACSLINDIPADACIIAYNMSFEKSVIKELSLTYKDIFEQLSKMHNSFIDLLDPFSKGYVYNKQMGNSFSIKSVLPALFPDDKELDYHNLSGVHNGGEAMDIFPRLAKMPLEERQKTRQDLLNYCKLDTYAMVKLLDKLKEFVG